MKSLWIGATVACVSLMAGCASFAVQDDALVQRTSTALGLTPDQFTISNRSDSGVRTDYSVKTTAGRNYACYVTGTGSIMGRVVSDAVCTQMNGNGQSSGNATQCNDLLRAAGKCN